MSAELKKLFAGPPKLTLAVAESVSCGWVQSLVGSVSGASDFFLGGITAYMLEQKVRHLGVVEAEARGVNCVSEEIALQMAQGACRLFGSDLALATTGYAQPSAEWNVDAPFAWWALCHVQNGKQIATRTGRIEYPRLGRVAVQERAAKDALAALELYLRELRIA